MDCHFKGGCKKDGIIHDGETIDSFDDGKFKAHPECLLPFRNMGMVFVNRIHEHGFPLIGPQNLSIYREAV